MVSYQFVFIGLLCFTHVTHSYVLLTANMEDVKKIARKFVPDSLADKIAEFIAKATENMVNVSEENEKNADEFQNLSADNNHLRNKGREDYEKTTRSSTVDEYTEPETRNTNIQYAKMTSKLKELVKMYESPSTIQSEEDFTTHKIEAEPIHWGKGIKVVKPVYEVSTNKPNISPNKFISNKKVNLKNNERPRRPLAKVDKYVKNTQQDRNYQNIHKYKYDSQKYVQNMDKEKTDNHKYRYEQIAQNKRHDDNQKEIYNRNIQKYKYEQNTQTETYVPTIRPIIDSTILYAEDPSIYNKQPKLKKPLPRGHRLTAFDSNESNPNRHKIIYEPVSKSTMRGFNIETVTQLKLTTEKEMAEFDQYDNRNYPRAEFIATSGPVALPKVPLQKPWWEKELPADNQRKVWYK